MVPSLPPGLLCLVFSHIVLLSHTTPALGQRIPEILQEKVTDYAPRTAVDCPDISTQPLLRTWRAEEQTLHPREEDYIGNREKTVLPNAWKDWLGDGSKLGYDISKFEGKWPRVGIAIPGGGLRAAQYGGACLEALDARNDSAKAAGTGGLLQVASYMTGLSGEVFRIDITDRLLTGASKADRGLQGRCSSTIGPALRNSCLAVMGSTDGCWISRSLRPMVSTSSRTRTSGSLAVCSGV